MNRKQKHNKLLVFDLELTCWERIREDGSIDKSPPQGMENEIIQFGYALINMSERKIEDKGSWLIKPKKSTISPFCKNLTGISQKMIDNEAISFELFRKQLEKKGFLNMPCTSWGYGDMVQLKEHCDERGLKYPLSRSHLCSKTLFTTYTGRGKGYGVKSAMDRLGLVFEGEHHQAMWDAHNTARILLETVYKGRLR